MAKLKNPLLSLRASGSLSKVISFVRRRGVSLVEKRPVLKDAQTAAQLYHRNMFSLCKDLWHTLSAAEKAVWEAAGTARHMTGYAWYLSQCLRPNPGIYLPLAGGTMTGDIAMGTNRIIGLPLPTGSGHATRKSYVDALDRGEGHLVILPLDYNSVGQGTWLLGLAATHILNAYFHNFPAVDGDNLTYKVSLDAGTYTLILVAVKDPGSPIVDIDIGGVQVASFDLYVAAIARNQRLAQTGIVIATPGLKDLRIRVDGKNALSASHHMYFNFIALWRTA